MDRNTLLAFGLSMFVVTAWMVYESRNAPPKVPAPGESAVEAPALDEGVSTEETATFEVADEIESGEAENWVVETPLYRAVVTSQGAAISEWVLKSYRDTKEASAVNVRLVGEGGTKALETSLEELGLGDLRRRNFTRVAGGEDDWVFEIESEGVRVRKTLVFDRENYSAALTLDVENLDGRPIQPRFDVGLGVQVRDNADFKDTALTALKSGKVERTLVSSMGRPGFFSSLFGGGEERVIYSEDLEWAGANSRYFLAALVPTLARTAEAEFNLVEVGKRSDVTVRYPGTSEIPEGNNLSREFTFYAGPKETTFLAAFGSNVDRSVDLGWSWVQPITRGFNWLLEATYRVIPNYGVSIILLTIVLRLVMWPLTAKQMKAMKKNAGQMGALQPKIKSIQERYADDTQGRNEEMMKLYREAGVNPLTMMGGGCLPMLLQLPVFIALYYALQSTIALRQAPFALWIQDLSIPETLFTLPGLELPIRVLPLAMGATMVLQQKLTPQQSLDPNQAKMMMTVMPIMFTVLFYGFPSGLVLYWFVSNLLAMAQQFWTNRTPA